MGYMRHHAIVVSGDLRPIEAARVEAEALGCVVSPVVVSPYNGYCSFFVAPDGSKEGWGESDTGDQQRAAMVTLLRTRFGHDGDELLDWAEVSFGGDDTARVCNHSNEEY